ncbi:multidrug ABC transporter ATP-binding protein [Eisenbergiella tayi]|uniref:Putative multidrug resistance ABC transporter ATP-binding/permease protein YheI n=1 Tax=Eisenbergiella tayi TaxID=1432052 RepID=A0A1E3AVZ6_9FIRM|nr:ABC transporter ATP-binding protein [Eisenbergiella tayi]ODM12862.1 putative multidrug resistance ABC transporter ATP-binding/permease protein YheI [Eisenbergiella tayi]OIZ65584.1 multidrug ABC transporter ATP-binding protein [Eisenbergiella tayi]
MNSFTFLFQYIKRHKYQYTAGIITLFVVDFANLFIPRLTGTITDGLTAHSLDWNGIRLCLLAIFGLGLTLALGRFLWRFFLFGASRSIEKELRNDMFRHLEKMSVEYYNEHKTGDLMTRFTSDLNAIRMAIGPAVICVFDASVMTIMVICQMMYYVNIRLTLLAIIPMLLICAGEIYYGKIMHARFRERQEAVSDLTDFVQESFSGVRVIKAFVRERSQMRAFARANRHTMDKNLNVVRLQAVVMPLLDVIIGLSSLITLVYGGYLALVGEITLGRFVAFNQYINMLVWPMLACGDAINMFSQGSASTRRIQEIFDEKPEIYDRKDVQPPDEIRGDITFSHLTFIHRGHSEPTLKDINLEIPAGTTLAIIGRTGNGKSTLVNLLLRLYNTKPGMILIDGRDINTIPLKALRENIAYVPQDNFLFSDTLKANIAFGTGEEDMDAITCATSVACIHENIVSFPDGYETIVGERGVTLSGGQKQRSSIARALMKDSPILILDDSLSAVDTDTEERILKNLKENRRGKTTLLIAHRISTIQNADVIMVLEDGEAKEIGNHESLMAQNGIYRDMFEKQQLEAAMGEEQAVWKNGADDTERGGMNG